MASNTIVSQPSGSRPSGSQTNATSEIPNANNKRTATPLPQLVCEAEGGMVIGNNNTDDVPEEGDRKRTRFASDNPFVLNQSSSLSVNARLNNSNFGPGGCGGLGGPSGGSGITPDNVPSTFRLENIGGLNDQISYLKRSIILPLVCPNFLKEWGVDPPKGILLHGPPGTGKTYMAKAIVNELQWQLGRKVNFFYRKGGDVFSMWFGESQQRLKAVFDAAKLMAPSVIFFDEIDGLCPSRESSKNHGTDAYASVVTCFLGQMDVLENGKVFVIGATNRVDAVDPAVRRPGRFDKHLTFGFPDEAARRAIFKIHTKAWSKRDQIPEDLLNTLAQRTLGYSGADIEKLCVDAVHKLMEDDSQQGNAGGAGISEKHWMEAIGEMSRTSSNSFGSALLIPTKPSPIVGSLIQPVVQEVTGKLQHSLSQNVLERCNSTCLNSFLLYVTPRESTDFMNNQIMHGILTHEVFSKMSIFEISPLLIANQVLSHTKPSVLASINDVVKQALDSSSEHSSVVVVFNIDMIFVMAERVKMPTELIINALGRVKGPRTCLFATSSVPLDQIKDQRVHHLFYDRDRQVLARNPDQRHINAVLKDLLLRDVEGNAEKKRFQAILEKTAKTAATAANQDQYEHVLNLLHHLTQVQLDAKISDEDLEKRYGDIVKSYQESKLRTD